MRLIEGVFSKKDIHAILAKFAEAISNEEPSQARYEKIVLLQDLDREINAATPTIDAEPVRYGRWIPREYDDGFGKYVMFHCSECDTREAKKENYCRECGVRMFLGGTYGEEQ